MNFVFVFDTKTVSPSLCGLIQKVRFCNMENMLYTFYVFLVHVLHFTLCVHLSKYLICFQIDHSTTIVIQPVFHICSLLCNSSMLSPRNSWLCVHFHSLVICILLVQLSVQMGYKNYLTQCLYNVYTLFLKIISCFC